MTLRIITLLFFCNILKGEIQINYNKDDAFGTHKPVLYQIAYMTTGPIIEFGCGNNSTEILHEICKKNKRLLISVDDNFEWLNKFSQKYLDDGYLPDNSGWHKFFFVPGKTDDVNSDHWIKFLDNFDLFKNATFDLCFIDQSPWDGRKQTIMRFKDKAKYLILHDCDYFVADKSIGKTIKPLSTENYIPGIYDFSNVFKYFKVYFPAKPWPGPTGPPTLLGSNFEDNLPDIDYMSIK